MNLHESDPFPPESHTHSLATFHPRLERGGTNGYSVSVELGSDHQILEISTTLDRLATDRPDDRSAYTSLTLTLDDHLYTVRRPFADARAK